MRVPSYRRHSSGQARVTIHGKDYLLGKYGSPESKERYGRLIAEYNSVGGTPTFKRPVETLKVQDLLLAYVRHAKSYYGAKSTEFANMKPVIRPINALYGSLPAAKFGPSEFTAIRQWWIDDGKSARSTINKQMGRTLRIFKWAVSQGMISAERFMSMKCVEPLRRGRCAAREAEPVKAVANATVEATLPHLTQILADMVRLQQLTGCRPGELTRIRPGMVDRSEKVWTITLKEHKTAHLGRDRKIYVGPKGQKILRRYLLRPAEQPCFSPKESEKQRRQMRHKARKTPLSCGNRPGTNRVGRKPRTEPGDAYTTHSYARAIQYACDRAFPPPKSIKSDRTKLREWRKRHRWSPNQLRHAAATEIRKRYGLEAAQVILGHASADVTQIYAERDEHRAIEVARLIG